MPDNRRRAVRLSALLVLWALAACAGGGSRSYPAPVPAPVPEPEPPPPPETLAGGGALRSRIEAAGGFQGMLVLFDEAGSGHAEAMRQSFLKEGVPVHRIGIPAPHFRRDDSIEVFLRDDEWADMRAETLVVAIPLLTALGQDGAPDLIAAHGILWVAAAGNTHQRGVDGDRDFWREDHPTFVRVPKVWSIHMGVFATGKGLIATVATRDGDGFAPSEGVVSCGDARHACFAVAQNEGKRLSTSWATGKLAVAGYYVFQLFADVADVVATLKACAIDAGEPGVDDEFGLGVASLACDEVEDAEVRTASASLLVRWGSPALDRLLGSVPQSGPSFDAGAVFADRRGRPLARLGASYGFGRGGLALAAGRTFTPLGATTSLTPRRPGTYLAAAGRWRLTGNAGGGLYAAASTGRAGGPLSPRASRTGLLYQRSEEGIAWSAYAGRAWHRAAIGIPGHREAGRGRSRAAVAGWEARLVLRWRF